MVDCLSVNQDLDSTIENRNIEVTKIHSHERSCFMLPLYRIMFG